MKIYCKVGTLSFKTRSDIVEENINEFKGIAVRFPKIKHREKQTHKKKRKK